MDAAQLAHALGGVPKHPAGFTACCPAHDDKTPSLSIDDSDNGNINPLVYCFAGCSPDAVVSALKDRGLWEGKDKQDIQPQLKRKVTARFPFSDQTGKVLYSKERLEPGKDGRKKDFVFKHIDPATGKESFGHGKHNPHILYNLDKVAPASMVHFFEGEGKADIAAGLGVVATSLDSGAKETLTDDMKSALDALTGKNVALYPDNDQIGHKFIQAVAADLHGKAKKVKIVILPGLPEKGDIKEWIAIPGNDKSKLLELAKDAQEWTPQDAPGQATGSTPTVESTLEMAAADTAKQYFPIIPFPAEILPEYMHSLTDRYAKALQCQFAFMAMAFLTVISGAIGNSVRLAIKSSWKTAPFLWLAIIDKTGAGKSHPIEAVMDPLFTLQSVEAARFEKEMEQYKIDESAFKKSKTDSDPPPEPEPMRHFYSSNFTVESLIGMFKKCARGVVIFVDELAGLVKGLNQYKGGKGSDDEQILSLFNCGPLKSDRVNKSGFSRESGSAVIGGIQPEVYGGVFDGGSEANGMLYRWLPLVMNAAPPMFSDDELTEQDTNEWKSIVAWMYEIPAEIDPVTGFIKKAMLTVEPAGRLLFREFHDELSRIQPFMPQRFAGYLPKLKTYCLKFMAILHVLECKPLNALALEVEAATVANAIKLTRYFAGQALQLITEQATSKDPHHAALQKAIESLRGEAVNGKVLLSRIRERMNELLPSDMQIEQGQNKKLATWLKESGIHSAPGTGNKVFATII